MVAHNLNPKQLQAVESSPGPLLIIAGAGSGKTKTLTNRLQYLLSNGVTPESIIAITFTNKAAGEMSARVARDISIFSAKGGSASGGKYHGRWPFIGTFHSLGARILRKEALNLGRGMNYTIYDSDDSLSAIKRTIKSLNLSKKDTLGPSLLRYYISKIKSGLITVDDLVDVPKLEVVKAVAEEYEKELARNNAFDFDDLILKPVQLWRENPLILQKYQDKYRYVLVDEFQDVNTAQYEFVRLLAKNHKNINVVGDDSQAIYGFRSANYKHFLNFEHDWPETKV
ncbi:MAG: UvrD-helicase domain-containing protein, partial [bacterium]|nr:UvrD-helicase domain-containing protein [bacterium]